MGRFFRPSSSYRLPSTQLHRSKLDYAHKMLYSSVRPIPEAHKVRVDRVVNVSSCCAARNNVSTQTR